MDPCNDCRQAGDEKHDCGSPRAFRLRCGALKNSKKQHITVNKSEVKDND